MKEVNLREIVVEKGRLSMKVIKFVKNLRDLERILVENERGSKG